MNELRTAQTKAREAHALMRALNEKIYGMRQIERSERLDGSEMIQLAHQIRYIENARDKARADRQGWKRVWHHLMFRRDRQPGFSARAAIASPKPSRHSIDYAPSKVATCSVA